MTALAGCMVACTGDTRSCHLTDGNTTSVHNLQLIVDTITDSGAAGDTSLEAFQLRWDQTDENYHDKYDVILSADCLFFKETCQSLVRSIHNMLRPNGKAVIVAPNREGTFDNFKNLAEELFTVEEIVDYSSEVTKAHESCLSDSSYNPDIHYPKLLILSK